MLSYYLNSKEDIKDNSENFDNEIKGDSNFSSTTKRLEGDEQTNILEDYPGDFFPTDDVGDEATRTTLGPSTIQDEINVTVILEKMTLGQNSVETDATATASIDEGQ